MTIKLDLGRSHAAVWHKKYLMICCSNFAEIHISPAVIAISQQIRRLASLRSAARLRWLYTDRNAKNNILPLFRLLQHSLTIFSRFATMFD